MNEQKNKTIHIGKLIKKIKFKVKEKERSYEVMATIKFPNREIIYRNLDYIIKLLEKHGIPIYDYEHSVCNTTVDEWVEMIQADILCFTILDGKLCVEFYNFRIDANVDCFSDNIIELSNLR